MQAEQFVNVQPIIKQIGILFQSKSQITNITRYSVYRNRNNKYKYTIQNTKYPKKLEKLVDPKFPIRKIKLILTRNIVGIQFQAVAIIINT